MDKFEKVVKVARKSKPFLGGVLFGTLGLKVLTGKDAKRLYANVIAKGYEARDEIEASIDHVKQQGEDVLADAQAIYEAKKEAEALELLGEAEEA